MAKKRLWLTRSHASEYAILWSGNAAPQKWFNGFYPHGKCRSVIDLCLSSLRSICGISLKPGECREVKSITFKFVEKKKSKKPRGRHAKI